jgi:hypothetical protein
MDSSTFVKKIDKIHNEIKDILDGTSADNEKFELLKTLLK